MTYLELGRIEDAEGRIERALSIDPRRPAYYQTLTRLKKLNSNDPRLDAMLALAADPAALGDAETVNLHFALGKALADVGRHEDAFEHLISGSKLKRRSVV